MIVASLILLVCLPFLVWPLLRPDAGEPEAATLEAPREAAAVLAEIEEVELDAAGGRLDPAEAARRLAELKREAAVRL